MRGVVTKDPDTNVMNVGIYRGMIGGQEPHPDPDVARPAYRPSRHAPGRRRATRKCRSRSPSAGSRRSASVAGSPVPKGMCEYDVMGAVRGAPVELVKCETVDLHVPATAEIVIEGYLGLDPETYMMEGPFAEFTGYVAGDTLAEADHPRHRDHPPQRSDPARHHRRLRCPAAFPRTRCAPRSCVRRRPGTCSTAPACPASPTSGARRCRPA